MTVLYDYWRSSAAYRVRIALNLKGVSYEQESVNLVSGAQSEAGYRDRINPQGLVPALVIGGVALTQSLAIIDYLEETIPEPPLLPEQPAERARVRAMAQVIACDIHPLNNLRVLKYLKGPLGQGQEAVDAWYRHWIQEGFTALERQTGAGPYLSGDRPGLADICLVPQMYNARRFNVDLDPFSRLVSIDEACRALSAFDKAAPENQPDAQR
ncbi:MAG: maleylacetoacetate isomerase [Alphaproteobacteria bacterium]|nr:MAG: maleylacetoacetate isomerase [Alphaproteobacteria bacterium]